MSFLESKFSREDLDTLLAALDDWEMLGNNEFHMWQMIKSSPMPPEDHEAYEAFKMLKESFAQREKEILATRAVRQERAVFLKAKLLMVRQDLAVDQLFEMATTSSVDAPKPVPPPKAALSAADPLDKFNRAEFFIKDLGVEEHYKKFLSDKDPKAVIQQKLEWAELFIKDLGVEEHYKKFLADQSA